MVSVKRLQLIKQRILQAKEQLFNSIAEHFGLPVPVRLVSQESIFLGAQGCYEGDVIKVNRDLPLFWQLIILEHEIGHCLSPQGKRRSGIIFQAFTTHHLSTEERRAWDWVEQNPIIKGGVIDKEVKKYINELAAIGSSFGHVDDIITLGWWY
jgi:uncharacterized membrane protein